MAIVVTGKPARTHYEVVERFGVATLLSCRLETGRTHQIRVHLASLGHPLIGDPAYGKRGPIAFARQALHAARLGLVHPGTGKACEWNSPLPADFAVLLDDLRARASSR
jgi:23S rRNA pseudouridine1911/1915/1917 synthase